MSHSRGVCSYCNRMKSDKYSHERLHCKHNPRVYHKLEDFYNKALESTIEDDLEDMESKMKSYKCKYKNLKRMFDIESCNRSTDTSDLIDLRNMSTNTVSLVDKEIEIAKSLNYLVLVLDQQKKKSGNIFMQTINIFVSCDCFSVIILVICTLITYIVLDISLRPHENRLSYLDKFNY